MGVSIFEYDTFSNRFSNVMSIHISKDEVTYIFLVVDLHLCTGGKHTYGKGKRRSSSSCY